MSTRLAFLSFSWLILGAFALATAGCNSGPGRTGIRLFPQGHKLGDEAKELRHANAPPIAIPRELDKQPLPPDTV